MSTESPRPTTASLDWHQLAACRGLETSFFYLEDGDRGAVKRQREHDAKQVCARCPVTRQCLSEALLMKERFGVWGGLTPEERSSLGREEAAVAS